MAEHNEFGKKGEEIALDFLSSKGYKILETNWRFRHSEIDIIAQKDEFLIIAEVKTRGSDFTQPQEAVNRKKQRLLIEAADAFVTQRNLSLEVRFDIISIVSYHGKTRIEHIENAFYPLL